MLNETFEKKIRPRDPEKMYTSEPLSGYISTQSPSPVLYNAGEVPVSSQRAIEYVPENTTLLPISECVLMLFLQLIPVLGILLDAVWSFSPRFNPVKITLARAMLIVQCILLSVLSLSVLIGLF